MKRGKRQVVELEPEPLKTQQNSSQFTNQYFSNSQNTFSNAQSDQHYQPQSRTIEIPKQSQTSIVQSKPVAEDTDEKKRKIELLKQKYLKKTKPEDAKTQSLIQQAQTVPNVRTNSEFKSTIANPQPKQQVKKVEPQFSVIQSSRPQQKIHEQPIYVEPKIQPKRQLFQQENSQHLNQQKTNNEIEQKIPETPVHHQVPKPPTRTQGRNPPPPPMKKNTLPPPIVHQNESSELSQEKLQTKTVPFPQKQKLIEETMDLNQKTEKSDNSSFAPPSLSTNEGSKQEKKGGPMVPPPPPNRNMKQILNKKLSSQKPVPKPPSRVQNVSVDDFNDETAQNPSVSQSHLLNSGINQKDIVQKQNYNHQIDDEYNGVEQEPVSNQKKVPSNKVISIKQADPSKFIGEWLGSPEMALKELFPELKQVIEFYCLHKNLSLKISSNNPGFTPLIAEFFQAFIINNTTKYTEDQKKIAESICLNFFYSSATEFSDVFLVLLVKLGEGYLQKYQRALEDKLETYLTKILFFKNLFLAEELSSFIAFCIEKNWVRQDNFVQFLMLSESSQLLGLIQNAEIHELRNKLGVLSFCKLNLKNKNLFGLYLKLISSIEVQLARNGLIEKILNHLKELDIPQNLYQYTKQLKLKLLKNYENNSQSDSQSFGSKVQQSNQLSASNNEANKDSGLFGYFNLNKAIDKIKTSTEKALGAVQKPQKPLQEEKKDEIVYDPIRKRYIINGQIPQDENESQHQQSGITEVKAKVPPPPPLGGGRKAPPPMHNKKPGPRIAGNRYA